MEPSSRLLKPYIWPLQGTGFTETTYGNTSSSQRHAIPGSSSKGLSESMQNTLSCGRPAEAGQQDGHQRGEAAQRGRQGFEYGASCRSPIVTNIVIRHS